MSRQMQSGKMACDMVRIRIDREDHPARGRRALDRIQGHRSRWLSESRPAADRLSAKCVGIRQACGSGFFGGAIAMDPGNGRTPVDRAQHVSCTTYTAAHAAFQTHSIGKQGQSGRKQRASLRLVT